MNAGELVEAIDLQDDTLSISLSFEERVRLVVDDAYSTFMHSKVDGLIRRAGLRYPNAGLRRIDLLDERGLNRQLLTQLGTCLFVTRQQNVVFQGFTGSGKSYLGCAIAKRACEHRIRAHYVRMPDLEEAWVAAQDTPGGAGKFLRKYATFTLLVIDEWLLDRPTESMRTMLLELMERRYGETSTVFCTQYQQKDWHHRLGAGVHADAIMDPHHPQHHLGRHRYLQHEGADRPGQRLTMRSRASGSQAHHHWLSSARSVALKRKIEWLSRHQILRAASLVERGRTSECDVACLRPTSTRRFSCSTVMPV